MITFSLNFHEYLVPPSVCKVEKYFVDNWAIPPKHTSFLGNVKLLFYARNGRGVMPSMSTGYG